MPYIMVPKCYLLIIMFSYNGLRCIELILYFDLCIKLVAFDEYPYRNLYNVHIYLFHVS